VTQQAPPKADHENPARERGLVLVSRTLDGETGCHLENLTQDPNNQPAADADQEKPASCSHWRLFFIGIFTKKMSKQHC
jgi:hypothetical protein